MEEQEHIKTDVELSIGDISRDTIPCPELSEDLSEETSPESDRLPVEYLHLDLAKRLTD
jgi:hypothetical protein